MTTEQNKPPPAHTPLPWSFDEQMGDLYCDDPGRVFPRIAKIAADETSDDQVIADGNFIARACNSHYELANALLDLHRYGQTDFTYLKSPAAATAHRALVTAGYLTEDGTMTAIAKAREQQ